MIPPSEWINADIVFLVTVRFAGHVWRFADRRIVVLDEDGQPIKLRTCETPLDIDESLGRLSRQQRGNRAAIRVQLPVDPVVYRRRGYRIDAADAEVAYVTARAGRAVQGFTDRVVVVEGRLREPQYGDPDLPTGTITATVEAVNTADRGVLVGDRVIDAFRFASTASRVVKQHGTPMPVVFGHPGAAGRPGSPGYPVDATGTSSRLLVAGHSVAAQTVQVKDQNGATANKGVGMAVDRLGGEYAYVDISTADGLDPLGDQFWISWTGTAATLPKIGGAGGIETAGQLALWALSRSSLPIDLASWISIAPFLDRFRVDGFLNQPIAPWEYVTRQIADLLPIGVVAGSAGLRPVLLSAPEVSGVPLITASRRFKQIGPWQIEGRPGDVANVVSVGFARDAEDNTTTDRIIYGSDSETTTARHSRELYGIRPRDLDVPLTDDPATATLIASSIVDREAILAESCTYQADLSFGWIRSGDWIRINDARLDVEDLLVQVIARRYLGAAWSFEVLRVDLPQRDAGRVG